MGPLVRILVQLSIAAMQVLGRSFAQAYAQAAANGGKVAQKAATNRRGLMSVMEAKQVLNIEGEALSKAEILSQYAKYYQANDPDKGGSYYLQVKFYNARETLLEEAGIPESEIDEWEAEQLKEEQDAEKEKNE